MEFNLEEIVNELINNDITDIVRNLSAIKGHDRLRM